MKATSWRREHCFEQQAHELIERTRRRCIGARVEAIVRYIEWMNLANILKEGSRAKVDMYFRAFDMLCSHMINSGHAGIFASYFFKSKAYVDLKEVHFCANQLALSYFSTTPVWLKDFDAWMRVIDQVMDEPFLQLVDISNYILRINADKYISQDILAMMKELVDAQPYVYINQAGAPNHVYNFLLRLMHAPAESQGEMFWIFWGAIWPKIWIRYDTSLEARFILRAVRFILATRPHIVVHLIKKLDRYEGVCERVNVLEYFLTFFTDRLTPFYLLRASRQVSIEEKSKKKYLK